MSASPPTAEAPTERLLARAVLVLILGVGAALRVWLALTDDGIYWPDEVFQSLEPAHRLVFGYGMRAWEFIEGARNWALPGVVALCPTTAVLKTPTGPMLAQVSEAAIVPMEYSPIYFPSRFDSDATNVILGLLEGMG